MAKSNKPGKNKREMVCHVKGSPSDESEFFYCILKGGIS